MRPFVRRPSTGLPRWAALPDWLAGQDRFGAGYRSERGCVQRCRVLAGMQLIDRSLRCGREAPAPRTRAGFAGLAERVQGRTAHGRLGRSISVSLAVSRGVLSLTVDDRSEEVPETCPYHGVRWVHTRPEPRQRTDPASAGTRRAGAVVTGRTLHERGSRLPTSR
jgi:hypothetical protein